MSLIQQLKAELNSGKTLSSPIVRWGIIASIIIILWSFVATPYMQWRQTQLQQHSKQLKQISRLQALKLAAQDWQQAEQHYQQANEQMLKALFQQSSYVTAQTELINLIRKQAKQHQITIDSQRLQESENQSNIGQRIGVTLRLHGELANTLRLIHSLSQHKKLLTIETIRIAKSRNNTMTITLKINGYRLTSATQQGQSA